MKWGGIAFGIGLLLGGVTDLRAESISFADDQGNVVQFESAPQRIVSLAPNITEILFAIGLGDRVIGVTEFCNYPEGAQTVEKVAGFNTLSVEKIIAAKADLVLASRGNDREGVETLRQMGVPVFGIEIQSIEQLLERIERLGKLGGVEEQAMALRQSLKKRVGRVRAKVDSLEERPRVMWGYLGEPVYTAGANTMIDDVFEIAGGTNVGRLAPGAWPQVGLETMVSWAPEVIITTDNMGEEGGFEKKLEEMRRTDGWKSLPAMRDRRVFNIDGDLLNRAGPRLIDALEQIATLLHPGVFDRP
ncbi:MAG: cobalamin-binding protein [Gemmatimonadetes bacterium]|jgi:iron complex transport system substrate-binding protein|nr:cobalamin-binding protein [Gemmatimonadota bacterium]